MLGCSSGHTAAISLIYHLNDLHVYHYLQKTENRWQWCSFHFSVQQTVSDGKASSIHDSRETLSCLVFTQK